MAAQHEETPEWAHKVVAVSEDSLQSRDEPAPSSSSREDPSIVSSPRGGDGGGDGGDAGSVETGAPSLEIVDYAEAFAAPRQPYVSCEVKLRLKADRERLDLIAKEVRDIAEAKIAAHNAYAERVAQWQASFARVVTARLEEERAARLAREDDERRQRAEAIAAWERLQVEEEKQRAEFRAKVVRRCSRAPTVNPRFCKRRSASRPRTSSAGRATRSIEPCAPPS